MTNSSSAGNEAGRGASVRLSPEQIAALFPFHFAFDAEMRLVQVGRSLEKIYPETVIGADVGKLFEIERPSSNRDWQGLRATQGQLFILRHRNIAQLRLRGQMMDLPDQGYTVFLCSPWLPEVGAMRTLGLKIADFPVHDSMPEFLQVVQAQSHALEDLRRLTERLKKQREELRAANVQLAEQDKEKTRLSMIAARTINAVIISDVEDRIEWVNESFERLTGYTLAEVKGRTAGAVLRGPETDARAAEYARQQVEQRSAFHLELLNYTKSGKRMWISVEAHPLAGADGVHEGYMAIVTDITARKQWERRSQLAYSVTKILAESTDVDIALPLILGKISEALGYAYGAIWRMNPVAKELRCWHQWRLDSLLGSDFETASREMRFAEGVGLPGGVWSSRKPQWTGMLKEGHFLRAGLAAAAGLRSGLAVPVEIGGEVYAVMEFFSLQDEEPSAVLIETVSGLGNQLGQFVEGRESEAQRGNALALLHSTIESTHDGILVTDIEGNELLFNERWVEMWRIPAELRKQPNREALFGWIHPQLLESQEREIKRAELFANPEQASDDLLRLVDGRVIQVTSNPHRMEQRIVGRVWIYRDVTQSLAEQDERDKLLATLNGTLEATNDGILVADLTQRAVVVNKRFLEIWKIPAGDSLDRTPGALRARARGLIAKPDVFDKRVQWLYEHPEESSSDVIHLLDGRVLERDTQPQRVGERVVGRLWSYRDVTERWRAEAVLRDSEERYRVVAETASDGIMTLDEEYRIEYANAAAHRIFGCEEGALAGTIIFEWSPEELRPTYGRVLQRMISRTPGKVASFGIELIGQRVDGQRVPLEVSYGESQKAGRRVYTAILRDISARKAAETQLKAAIREAENANQAKGDFLANMSHEIRTPLNAVLGLTELLKTTRLDVSQREMLDSVGVGAESLLHLINDLLDFSKIEAGQVDIESTPFDPMEVVEQAVEILRVRAEAKGLQLYFIPQADSFRLRGDANRIRQILINLISNATKFTDRGSIVVRLAMERMDSGRVDARFSVEDTGIGIPAQAMGQVFQKFFRVDAPAVRRAGGAGLGLSISRLLSEAMGGELTLESVEGRGSRFSLRITLPVTEMFTEQRPITEILLLAALERRNLSQEAMTAAGYAVHTFTDAAAALTFADQFEAETLFVFDEGCRGTAEQLRQLARLTSLGKEARFLRITGPGIAGRSMDGMPGRGGELAYPLTPGRIGRAISRLFVDEATLTEAVHGGHRDVVPHGRPLRVLLVEDNPAGQDYANRVLVKEGHSVALAATVSAAVRAGTKERFDVILMDLMLPDGSGFEATGRIRAHEAQAGWKRTPIIALTAHAMQAYREQAFSADMDDYVTKPFRPQALVEVVERWGRVSPPREVAAELILVDMDLADLIPGFLHTVGQQVASVRKLAESGELAQAARLGHNLKGTGSSYGFDEITRVGAAMEERAKAGAAKDVDELAAGLEAWLANLRWEPEER
jgi:PAS domain S-box-containing protein